ncbi:MAG: right-handed parallel beta-helix repeat-containing protein [Candidatus Zixiibacteriota bacterium]|nr:MAG: right-handed parallel beta-helix repeat-containing protein [candidate division Zixibacteria bacterium]
MAKKILLILSIMILLEGNVWPVVINIPDDYPTIQQGIDAGSDGDTVLVQPGTYYENVNFNGRNIVLGSLFLTTGDTSYIALTMIDGSLSPTTDGHIHFGNGEDNSARVTGFTIQNPSASSASNIYCEGSRPTINYNVIRNAVIIAPGGGICCKNSASPIISYNVIIDNVTNDIDLGGGGIFCWRFSDPVIIGNIISGNISTYGGGIHCFMQSNPTILNNKISENSAWFGGGILCVSCDVIIQNNEIINNTSQYYGGGIYCGGPTEVIISNNVIARNVASNSEGRSKGGGIYCQAIDPVICNNNIYGNFADSVGGGIFCRESHPHIINSIFRGDSIGWPSPVEANEIFLDSSSAVVEYCNIQGGWPGTGNIDMDPLFRNPVDGDFHLMATDCGDSLDSPCIDAGSPYYADSLLDCAWGLGTTASDMGAYGGGDTAQVGISHNAPSLPKGFILLQNYPNPFNSETTVRFVLVEPAEVKLTVYDLLGREVRTLSNLYKQTGIHSITFEASSLPSGIFFYRLRAGDMVDTKKMILLK